MKDYSLARISFFMLTPVLLLSWPPAHTAAERPQDELAAQVHLQGFTCDKALGATRDRKQSRPDYAVWVLKCTNATYRIGRAPDMAAKVEPLQ